MTTRKLIPTLFTLFLAATPSFAATEQWIRSLRGENLLGDAPTLHVYDPEFNYNTAYPDGLNPRFSYTKAQAAAVLRFDDSDRELFTADWNLTVTFDITVHSANGTVTTYEDQQVAISYTVAGGTYSDIAERYFNDVVWASLRVTDVDPASPSVTNANDEFPEDIYLDLRLDVDRYYILDDSETPLFTDRNTDNVDQGFLGISWDYVEGALSYDLEWLFVDVATEDIGASYPYDFVNATRVNTSYNNYDIPLAYPRGILLWRTRPVGVDGPFGKRLEGTWSGTPYPCGGGCSTDDVTDPLLTFSLDDGLEYGLNWQYTGNYAERGMRKDLLSFLDGAQRQRQSMTLLNTDDLSLIDHKMYDLIGRPALQLMPYPIAGRALQFHEGQVTGYDISSYDTDTKLNDPDPFPTSGSGSYYDATNVGIGVLGSYAPDAQHFPYSRTLYMNDGSGRVREQAGPGPDHNMESGHTTRYVYGTPGSQFELDRLFGNEVGYVNHYKKNLVIDPNGVVSVSYLDPEGRTIATALAGGTVGADALEDVDGYEDTEVDVTDSPILSSLNDNGTAWYSAQVITIPGATHIDFSYTLDPATFEQCIERPCTYNLTIRVLDDCGGEKDINPAGDETSFILSGITEEAGLTFGVDLDPGGYTIEKFLQIDETSLLGFQQDFIGTDDPPCVSLVEPDPQPCDQDCASLCHDAYTTMVDDVEWYVDANGVLSTPVSDSEPEYNETAAEEILALILECETACADPGIPTPCELRYALLLADVSSHGQYFDNLPHAFDEDYDPNSWLEDVDGLPSPEDLTDNEYTTWDEVRENWNEEWAQQLVPFHPEFCGYQFYCVNTCTDPLNHTSGPFYGEYYATMYAESSVTPDSDDPPLNLLNPLNQNPDTDPNSPSYQPIPANLGGDDMLVCLKGQSCPELSSSVVGDGLMHFFPYNGVDASMGYYSIWAVIFDPSNIADGNGGYGSVPTSVREFFDIFHGDGTPGNLGILSDTPDPSQLTPYQFFRSVYDFYRELFAYTVFQNGCLSEVEECGGFLESPNNDGLDANGFLIRYPHNPVFDGFPAYLDDPTYFADQFVLDEVEDGCQTQCEAAADAVLAQVQGCLDEGFSLTCVRQALIDVCMLGCDADHLQGSSEGDGSTAVEGCTSSGFGLSSVGTSFDEVLAFYGADCPPMQYPQEPQPIEGAECHCEHLHSLFAGLEIPIDGTYSSEDIAAVTSALDQLHTDEDTYDLISGSIDWDVVLSWLAECADSPSETDLLGTLHYAIGLRCDDIDLTPSGCEEAAMALAQYNADLINSQLLQNGAQAWAAGYRVSCMDDLAQRETFTMSYTLNEYHYTLYYYDQAGNLVKTVPPAGVNLDLSADYTNDDGGTLSFDQVSFMAATALRRDGTPGADYIRPKHSMVTWYKFNSFQQPVEQNTPDGGSTSFFYDKLGRLVASKNAVQKDLDDQGTGYRYTYTFHDQLGRPIQTGQMTSDVMLTANIARGAEPTYPDGFYRHLPASSDDYESTTTDREQISRTKYDDTIALPEIATAFGPSGQQNLRNRVASSTYLESPADWANLTDAEYDQATHYSYDIHGNVSTLVQEIRELEGIGQSFKRMDYEYDYLSGNVEAIHYQGGQWDEYHQRYRYDADNRLLEARTSRDGRIWERDARYFYYTHGPLARTELGDKQVQGVDQYYTLQGWLKGVNSIPFDPASDPGQDGLEANLDHPFTNDAFAYALQYFPGDFNPVQASNALPENGTGDYAAAFSERALYNGNIPGMLTALQNVDGDPLSLHANVFTYDKLNRIKAQRVFQGAASTDLSGLDDNGDYATSYVYDPNGNILFLNRNGYLDDDGVAPTDHPREMDDLAYDYVSGTNKLDHVADDPSLDPNFSADLKSGQLGTNYDYDLSGHLTQDQQASIGPNGIAWTLSDKVRSITRNSTLPAAPNLEFRYNTLGQRTVKRVKPRVSGTLEPEEEWTTEYYIRDAQGNPMAIYERTYSPIAGGGSNDYDCWLNMKEAMTYGSARVNVWNCPRQYHSTFAISGYSTLNGEQRFSGVVVDTPLNETDNGQLSYPFTTSLARGTKTFELGNHLGNVLSTISDRRIAVSSMTEVAYYRVEEISVGRYYPLGSPLPDPNTLDGDYRFAFQGQEKDDEINGTKGANYDFGARMMDSRIGRWLSVDPLAQTTPNESPYSFAGNNPILNIDPSGRVWINYWSILVKQFGELALKYPDDLLIKETLEHYIKQEEATNSALRSLKKWDFALYDYIDNLQIQQGGFTLPVPVYVWTSDEQMSADGRAMAETHTRFIGDKPPLNAKYKDKYIVAPKCETPDGLTPMGAEIILYKSIADEGAVLANEAGDVMFFMEYNDASWKSGDDVGKTQEEYLQKGSAGDYSMKVMESFTTRRNECQESEESPQENPYPLSDE